MTVEAFVEALGLKHYALYIFDYGAPTGLRLALAHPERVTAIISQNGNAYEEGLGDAWNPIRKYWQEPTAANRDALRPFIGFEGTRFQYVHGTPVPARGAEPTGSIGVVATAGQTRSNSTSFLTTRITSSSIRPFRSIFEDIIRPCSRSGKHPFFIPPGAEAFHRDIPEQKWYFTIPVTSHWRPT